MSDAIETSEAVAGAESVGEADPVADAPVGAPEGTDAGVAEERPFFEWEHPETKEKHVFKKPGELADHLKHSSMFRKDYESERSKVQERAKYLEEQIKKNEALERQMLESDHSKLARWAEQNPRKWQQLQEAWKKDTSPQQDPVTEAEKRIEEKYGARFKELDERERQRQEREEHEKIVGSLKSKYPDIDDSLFDREMDRLRNMPEAARREAWYELMYHAARGRQAARPPTSQGRPNVTSPSGSKMTGVDVTKLPAHKARELAEAELAKMGIGDEE